MRGFFLFVVSIYFSTQLSYSQFLNGVPRYFKTPNDHTICDEHGEGNCINAPVGALNKWYFYKDKIIGVSSSGYFILNEVNLQDSVYITNSESEWKKRIESKNLKPFIWTR